MNWFINQRMRWITETLHVFGFINREHIVRKFDVTPQQASRDINDYIREHPGRMTYDKSKKCYVAMRRRP